MIPTPIVFILHPVSSDTKLFGSNFKDVAAIETIRLD
jgi:hypothetical protein